MLLKFWYDKSLIVDETCRQTLIVLIWEQNHLLTLALSIKSLTLVFTLKSSEKLLSTFSKSKQIPKS